MSSRAHTEALTALRDAINKVKHLPEVVIAIKTTEGRIIVSHNFSWNHHPGELKLLAMAYGLESTPCSDDCRHLKASDLG